MCLESLIIEIWRFVFSSLYTTYYSIGVPFAIYCVLCVCTIRQRSASQQRRLLCMMYVFVCVDWIDADVGWLHNNHKRSSGKRIRTTAVAHGFSFRMHFVRNFIRKYCGWTSIAWHEWLWAGSGYSLNICSDRPTRRPMSWKCFFLACECSLADNTL